MHGHHLLSLTLYCLRNYFSLQGLTRERNKFLQLLGTLVYSVKYLLLIVRRYVDKELGEGRGREQTLLTKILAYSSQKKKNILPSRETDYFGVITSLMNYKSFLEPWHVTNLILEKDNSFATFPV